MNKSSFKLTLLILTILLSVNIVNSFQLLNRNKALNQDNKLDATPCQNITHFQFRSQVNLGKSDQANKTFSQLQQRITKLPEISYKFNDTTSFKIFNAVPTFYYRDSKQKAEIVGNNSILIDGGFTQATINFQWMRTGSQSRGGNGTAFGLTDQVIYAKKIIIENDFFKYDLLDYINITFENPMNLTRYSPADTSDQDKSSLLKMINVLFNSTTLRHALQDQIDKSFAFILKQNLNAEARPINEHFEYNWTDSSKNNLIIKYAIAPKLIDIQKDGIHYGMQFNIKDTNNSECGVQPPRNPQNPKVFGGSQQFLSFTFMSNSLRYAIQKGALNTNLNRQNWQSRMFQFFAGDLYDLFPQVARTQLANSQVTGACNANTDHLLIYKAKNGNDTFNVTFHSRCSININKKKIIDFDVGLQLTVQGIATEDHLDFVLKSHTQFVSFYDAAPYKIQNELLARQMVSRSLNRLYQNKLFGSAWPTGVLRDYPHFQVQSDYVFIWDSTHL